MVAWDFAVFVLLLPFMRMLLFIFTFLLPVFTINAQVHNTLTEKEKKEGWVLLFDGKSISNWHTYGKKGVGPAWQIKDEALMLNSTNRAGNKTAGGGDLATNETFQGDFEFKIDWKVSPLANSGLFLFVQETPKYKEIYHTGLEIQVTDNEIHKNAKADNKHRAGDIFGVISTSLNEAKPTGQWNEMHVILSKGRLKVFLNGFEIHNINLNSAEWKKMIAESGLKDAPVANGKYSGKIGLQDWGSSVWYRNIKIRKL